MLETNKIYNVDCLDGMKQLDDNSIDLTVTSPPYNNLRTYQGFSWNYKETAKQLYRVTKKGGVVVWVVGDATVNGSETGTSFKQALYFKDIGFRLHDTMIYQKGGSPYPSSPKTGVRYTNVFEYMFVLSKGKPKTINLIADKENKYAGTTNWGDRMMRQRDGTLKKEKKPIIAEYGVRYNIWYYKIGKGFHTKDEIAYQHPAIFPEKLAEDHILSWSNKGDLVLDPFLGSGTTLKMAELNSRNWIGFEISEEYCKIAEERLRPIKCKRLGNI